MHTLRQLARPYEITAIGDRGPMLEEVRTGYAGRYVALLRDSYGVSVSVEGAEDVVLPAASRLTLRQATGVDGASDEAPDRGSVEQGEEAQS